MQHEDAHVRARVPGRQRLAVRPDAQHRVGGTGVVLGNDGDAHAAGHQPVWACTVSWAWSRLM
jgi:hypothetical protein